MMIASIIFEMAAKPFLCNGHLPLCMNIPTVLLMMMMMNELNDELKLTEGCHPRKALFGGIAFPTKVTLGSFLPSMIFLVKLPNRAD